VPIKHEGQCRRTDQRAVAAQNKAITGKIGGECIGRTHDRVPGPELLGLHGKLAGIVLQGITYELLLVAHDRDDSLCPDASARIDDRTHHRTIAHWVNDLGQVRLHPGAFAGGEDDC
jgi:hypothetical protein